MKLKKVLSGILAAAVAVSALAASMSMSVVSAAEEYATSGTWGTDGKWVLSEDGTLTVTGTGALGGSALKPKMKFSGDVNKIVFGEGITQIASYITGDRLTDLTDVILPSTLESSSLDISKCKNIFIYSKNAPSISSVPASGSGAVIHLYKDSETEKNYNGYEKIEYIDGDRPQEPDPVPAVLPVETETSGISGLNSSWSWDEATKTLTFAGSGGITITDGFQKLASKIEKVEMKDTEITSICDGAFGPLDNDNSSHSASLCPNLKSVTFPETLEKIGNCAFNKTALSMENLELPEGLESIGRMAFFNTNLTGNLKLPSTLKLIDQSAFENTDISSVNLIEGMTLGGVAFAGCNSLKELIVPKNINYNVTGVSNMMRGNSAFARCEGLERVIIKGGGTVKIHLNGERENGLSQQMFNGCTSLKEIIIETDNLSFVETSGSGEQTFDLSSNPTFYIYKDSTTEKTLRDAGYLTGTNVVYIANKSALSEAVETAEAMDTSLHTDESVANLKKAIEAAKAVLDNLDAAQDSVDAALKQLKDAVSALKYKPADYTAVDEAIAKVPEDLSIYTDKSVAALKSAIEAVDRTKNITEQETVDEYVQLIEDAIAALELKPLGSINGTITSPGTDAAATVTVTTVDGEKIAEVTANGEYSISDLEDGNYVMIIAAENCAPRSYSVTVSGGEVTVDAEIHIYGDINGDGEITTADVGIANSHAREVAALEDYDFKVADVTGDGEVTTADVGVINSTARGIN